MKLVAGRTGFDHENCMILIWPPHHNENTLKILGIRVG